MKFDTRELHMALVSQQNCVLSENGSHLKKSVSEVEFDRSAKLVLCADTNSTTAVADEARVNPALTATVVVEVMAK